MVDRRVTPDEAASLLDVPVTLIASWKHRRRITPVAYIKGKGRDVPVYALTELQPLADEWRARRNTRAAGSK